MMGSHITTCILISNSLRNRILLTYDKNMFRESLSTRLRIANVTVMEVTMTKQKIRKVLDGEIRRNDGID